MFGGVNANAVVSQFIPPYLSGTTLITDASKGNAFSFIMDGDYTLALPTSPIRDGHFITWRFIQDGVGSRLLTLHANFDVGPFTVTLSTATGAVDYLAAIYREYAGKWDIMGFNNGYA